VTIWAAVMGSLAAWGDVQLAKATLNGKGLEVPF